MDDSQSRRYSLQPLRSDFIPKISPPREQILWVGCSDSSCEELALLDVSPDDIFQHRNLGNILIDDLSCTTAVRYAVSALNIDHIVICGHYGCGIVKTAQNPGLKDPWTSIIDGLRTAHSTSLQGLTEEEQDRRLVEWNVVEQIRSVGQIPEVVDAIDRRGLKVHGVFYDSASRRGYRVTNVGIHGRVLV
ncbi:putative carbonate dehydratase [Aspergillus candidus]|uniref:Carbonic anhydrase n=1 Tax=Aspergillus candidus TaxID=41067 RepID=A0A2I2F844_ASPCN|nr:putative carbonate dehydratase [Aspergillus candidus]PLB36795.1 putative carbonate dehydratase [Aspergillus candidus]